jgi:transposase-like protein
VKHPESLLEATRLFSNPRDAHDYLAAFRFPDGVIPCPQCGSNEPHLFLENQLRWKCRYCKKQFSVKVGTIFEDSPLGLDKWLIAAWLICNCKNGISSCELARDLKVCQKTAWFMLHRLRLALQEGTFERFGDEGTEVEIDETGIGGKAKFMHKADKARKIGDRRGLSSKDIVLGMLERGGKVRTFHVPTTHMAELFPRIFQNVKPGAKVYTDAMKSYDRLSTWYDHEFVDHAISYVEDRIHTNGLENYWSLLKRSIKGTYVSVEAFHLFRYLDEQSFRYNERKGTDGDRFVTAMSSIAGRRITYRQLTGKEYPPAGITV